MLSFQSAYATPILLMSSNKAESMNKIHQDKKDKQHEEVLKHLEKMLEYLQSKEKNIQL